MLQAYLLFITGLTLSGVAIYYSVAGLGAIFAGALVPIYIMGTSLELAKLVAASWLKANWQRAPWFMRLYIFAAIAGLMAITSIGVFGYLSKAHIEQSSSASTLQAKVDILNSRIDSEKSIIQQYRTDLEVLNGQIAKFSELGSVSKGVVVRESQKAEREQILEKIDQSQNKINSLQQEKEPFDLQLRSVEAEVGPIKYIAAFVYGDHPDSSTLEKSVTWLIILIVVIFDPLAIALLLAAQLTFGWVKQEKQAISVLSSAPSTVATESVVSTDDNSYNIVLPDHTNATLNEDINSEEDTSSDEIVPTLDSQVDQASAGLAEVVPDEEHVIQDNMQDVNNDRNSADLIVEEAKRYIVKEPKKKGLHDQGLARSLTDSSQGLKKSAIWNKIAKQITRKTILDLNNSTKSSIEK